MSVNYSNNFSEPDPDNSAFAPQMNNYEVPYSPTGGPQGSLYWKPFGDMFAGMSVDGPTGTPVPPLVLPISAPPGITLELRPNSNDQYSDSQPIYLTNLSRFSRFFLPADSRLTAEILFDRPLTLGTFHGKPVRAVHCNAMEHKWAVGLALKSGTQNEFSDDQRIGVTCQFFNGGSMNFHKTDYNNGNTNCPHEVPYKKTYTDYWNDGTVFALSLSIWREGTAVVGKGAFYLTSPTGPLGDPIVANLTIPKDPATKAPYTNIDWVSALGVSLVSAKNDLDLVSVRLRKFTVSVASLLEGPEEVLIRHRPLVPQVGPSRSDLI